MRRSPDGPGDDRQTSADRAWAKNRRSAARYRWGARALFAAAVLITGQHLLAHSGAPVVPLSMGWSDLLIGYPTAGIVAVIGLFVWSSEPGRS